LLSSLRERLTREAGTENIIGRNLRFLDGPEVAIGAHAEIAFIQLAEPLVDFASEYAPMSQRLKGEGKPSEACK